MITPWQRSVATIVAICLLGITANNALDNRSAWLPLSAAAGFLMLSLAPRRGEDRLYPPVLSWLKTHTRLLVVTALMAIICFVGYSIWQQKEMQRQYAEEQHLRNLRNERHKQVVARINSEYRTCLANLPAVRREDPQSGARRFLGKLACTTNADQKLQDETSPSTWLGRSVSGR